MPRRPPSAASHNPASTTLPAAPTSSSTTASVPAYATATRPSSTSSSFAANLAATGALASGVSRHLFSRRAGVETSALSTAPALASTSASGRGVASAPVLERDVWRGGGMFGVGGDGAGASSYAVVPAHSQRAGMGARGQTPEGWALEQPRAGFRRVGSGEDEARAAAGGRRGGGYGERGGEGVRDGDDDGGILVRNERGVFVDEPVVPGLGRDGEEEEVEEDGEEGEDVEEVDTSAIEMWRDEGARGRVDVGELKAQLQASLLQKVASLDDDRWMFEEEEDDDESF